MYSTVIKLVWLACCRTLHCVQRTRTFVLLCGECERNFNQFWIDDYCNIFAWTSHFFQNLFTIVFEKRNLQGNAKKKVVTVQKVVILMLMVTFLFRFTSSYNFFSEFVCFSNRFGQCFCYEANAETHVFKLCIALWGLSHYRRFLYVFLLSICIFMMFVRTL